jgi:hypothetical protein
MKHSADHLSRTVESLHHVRATPVQTVPVHETFRGQVVCDGVVHVFDIEGHLESTRAYARSRPEADGTTLYAKAA